MDANALSLIISTSPAQPAPMLIDVPPHRVSAFDLVASQPWAILPSMLETIGAIARRENDSVEALEARLGRPLQNTRSVKMRDGVATIPITGPVFRYANLFSEISGAVSLDVLATDLTRAIDDPSVKSIVLVLDSPGGQANGISEFAAMVRASTKPVVAYVDGSAASAAYWIASAADEIFISKTGEVGSIGAVVSIDTRGKKDGVMEIVSSQSPNKRPDVSTDAGRALIQARIDQFAQVFIEDVAAYRRVSVDHVLGHYGQGDMRMGAEAVRLGMADRVSTLEEVIAGLTGTKPKGNGIMNTEAQTQAPVITREYLAANHADLIAALQGEGATAERTRMLDVQAQSMPGHEALIATLMADGVTSGPQAAVQILAAEKALGAQRIKDFKADGLKPVAFAPASTAAEDAASGNPSAIVDASLPVETRCKNAWEADSALHAEFTSLAAYTAYTKASESGLARLHSK